MAAGMRAGPHGLLGQRCPSKSINSAIEEAVWRDGEAFLRDPQPVLAQLAERVACEADTTLHVSEEALRLKTVLARLCTFLEVLFWLLCWAISEGSGIFKHWLVTLDL